MKVKPRSKRAIPLLRLTGFTYVDGEWVLLQPEGSRHWPPWPHLNQLLYLLKRNGLGAKIIEQVR